MPDNEQLRRDLDYVKSAIERQQRLVCEYVPVWFAAAVGAFFVVITATRDLAAAGAMDETLREWIRNIGWFALVALLFVQIGRKRRARTAETGRRAGPGQRAREAWHLAGPFALLIGAIVLMRFLGAELGVAIDQLRPLMLIFMGAGMAILGLGRISVVFWFGVSLLLGVVPLFFAQFAWPYTILGLLVAAGLVFGARRDQARFRARGE